MWNLISANQICRDKTTKLVNPPNLIKGTHPAPKEYYISEAFH